MGNPKIKVCVRTRPLVNPHNENFKVNEENNSIDLVLPKSTEYLNHQVTNFHYQFDHIFHNSNQHHIYDSIGIPSIDSVLNGYNSSIIAYGQTGSGKTYTMSGNSRDYEERGLVSRCISELFRQMQSRTQMSYKIQCSYMEIYNELLFDLLATTPSNNSPQLQEDAEGNISVKNLTFFTCNSELELLEHYFRGEAKKAISHHELNDQSSRSHVIFTVLVTAVSRVSSREKKVVSKLNFIDLAGSERIEKSNNHSPHLSSTLAESLQINKSLSILEQVIHTLEKNKKSFVPYRSSKLTHFLKDSLGGNSLCSLLVHIWPEPRFLEESYSSLKFASKASHITNAVVQNVVPDSDMLIRNYEKEINLLRQELALYDTMNGKAVKNYTPLNEREIVQLREEVTSYMNGAIDHMDVFTVRKVQECLPLCRELFQDLKAQFEKLQGEVAVPGSTGARSLGTSGTDTQVLGGVGKLQKELDAAPLAKIDGVILGIAEIQAGEEPKRAEGKKVLPPGKATSQENVVPVVNARDSDMGQVVAEYIEANIEDPLVTEYNVACGQLVETKRLMKKLIKEMEENKEKGNEMSNGRKSVSGGDEVNNLMTKAQDIRARHSEMLGRYQSAKQNAETIEKRISESKEKIAQKMGQRVEIQGTHVRKLYNNKNVEWENESPMRIENHVYEKALSNSRRTPSPVKIRRTKESRRGWI